MILIDNKEGLIGDFLGTIPAMQKLTEQDQVLVKLHPEAKGLFRLIENWNLIDYDKIDFLIDPEFEKQIILSSSEAFQIAVKKNYYMTQAFMEQAGLEVLEVPSKAKLNYINAAPLGTQSVCDYLISPFARSLPSEQKWSNEKWSELVRSMPHKIFGLLGNSKYDDRLFLHDHENVIPLFDLNFDTLCGVFKNSECLISVVTGTSHLAFHLGVKNILLTNQLMTWGNNPDAILIADPIRNITVKQVIEKIESLYDKSNI